MTTALVRLVDTPQAMSIQRRAHRWAGYLPAGVLYGILREESPWGRIFCEVSSRPWFPTSAHSDLHGVQPMRVARKVVFFLDFVYRPETA